MWSPRARNTLGGFVSRTQLDKLEECGYLDLDLRGNRVEAVDAIETFQTLS